MITLREMSLMPLRWASKPASGSSISFISKASKAAVGAVSFFNAGDSDATGESWPRLKAESLSCMWAVESMTPWAAEVDGIELSADLLPSLSSSFFSMAELGTGCQ